MRQFANYQLQFIAASRVEVEITSIIINSSSVTKCQTTKKKKLFSFVCRKDISFQKETRDRFEFHSYDFFGKKAVFSCAQLKQLQAKKKFSQHSYLLHAHSIETFYVEVFQRNLYQIYFFLLIRTANPPKASQAKPIVI